MLFAPLIAVLKDKSEYVRQYAAQSLGQLKDKRTAAALILVLKDEKHLVRQAAKGALDKLSNL